MGKDYVFSTHEVTGSACVVDRNCRLWSCLVITNGSANAVITIHDNNSAVGNDATNKLAEFTVVSSNQYGGRNWIKPVGVEVGIYVTISGTGASCIIEYDYALTA